MWECISALPLPPFFFFIILFAETERLSPIRTHLPWTRRRPASAFRLPVQSPVFPNTLLTNQIRQRVSRQEDVSIPLLSAVRKWVSLKTLRDAFPSVPSFPFSPLADKRR